MSLKSAQKFLYDLPADALMCTSEMEWDARPEAREYTINVRDRARWALLKIEHKGQELFCVAVRCHCLGERALFVVDQQLENGEGWSLKPLLSGVDLGGVRRLIVRR